MTFCTNAKILEAVAPGLAFASRIPPMRLLERALTETYPDDHVEASPKTLGCLEYKVDVQSLVRSDCRP